MYKKSLALIMSLILAVSLTACGQSSSVAEETKTQEQTTQAEDTEDTEEAGESGETEETAEEETGGNMIKNGDFSAGIENWALFKSGGQAEMAVNEEEQLQVDIDSVGSVEHGVQIYYDGFTLDTGCVYKYSFDIASTSECVVQWRLQINGGDYHAYVSDYVTINEEMQTVECEFTMEEGSDPAPRLCINMGKMEDNPEDLAQHSVMVDNFYLEMIDDSNMVQPDAEIEKPDVNVNQVGYRPEDSKSAVLRGDAIGSEFTVVNVDTDEVVFTGTVGSAFDNENAGEKNAIADFSEVTEEGTYKVVANQCESYPFVIAEDVYQDLMKDLVKMFYLQRCGTELTEEYAGDFVHPACHTEKAVIYGTKKKIDVSGGWHDAGDYGRYVVPGAKAVMDLFLAYEAAPELFTDDYGIPESGNGVSDLLDECRYELEWMLKMQDSKSGGVYHKVTCANFPETVMPQEETDQLIVSEMSTAATGDFSAVMARAYTIYKDIDKTFAKKCLNASKRAYNYLVNKNSGAGFRNPSDIVTGEYPDGRDNDERLLAAVELYRATGEKTYHEYALTTVLNATPRGLGWASVGTYAILTYLSEEKQDETFAKELSEILKEQVNKLVETANADGYGCTLGAKYPWGSNMSVANNGMLLLMADEYCGDDTTKRIAKEQLDYLLGRNANSYCFVTGYGTLSPESPHHRPSQVLEQAMKGMVIGGPDNALEDPYAKAVLAEEAPAKCYADNSQSFSCNEITIYWNSPAVCLLAMLLKK